MDHPFTVILDNLNKPFYFGMGGIGDFLLLMSTFYDDVEPGSCDVVFIANNVKQMKKLTDQSVNRFGKVNKFWFFPINAFPRTVEIWDSIVSNPLCIGTGVTPKKFDYINDWENCGKTNVFEYYGACKPGTWKNQTEKTKSITIQPVGGKDSNRISIIPIDFVVELAKLYGKTHTISIIGSGDQVDPYIEAIGRENIEDMISPVCAIVDFNLSFLAIECAQFHVGVNSWCKTYARLVGTETYIYPSSYVRAPIKTYGTAVDPSDHVFINHWGFYNAHDLVNT